MPVHGTVSLSQRMPACGCVHWGGLDARQLVPATFCALEIALTNGEPKGMNHTIFQQKNSFVRVVLHFF